MSKLALLALVVATFVHACWLVLWRRSPDLPRKNGRGHGRAYLFLTIYFMGWLGADCWAGEQPAPRRESAAPSFFRRLNPAKRIEKNDAVSVVAAAWTAIGTLSSTVTAPDGSPAGLDAFKLAMDRKVEQGELTPGAAKMLVLAYHRTAMTFNSRRRSACYAPVSVQVSDVDELRERYSDEEWRRIQFRPSEEPALRLKKILKTLRKERPGPGRDALVQSLETVLLSMYISDRFALTDEELLAMIRTGDFDDARLREIVTRAFNASDHIAYEERSPNAIPALSEPASDSDAACNEYDQIRDAADILSRAARRLPAKWGRNDGPY